MRRITFERLFTHLHENAEKQLQPPPYESTRVSRQKFILPSQNLTAGLECLNGERSVLNRELLTFMESFPWKDAGEARRRNEKQDTQGNYIQVVVNRDRGKILTRCRGMMG